MSAKELMNELMPNAINFDKNNDIEAMITDLQIDYEQKNKLIYAMCMFLDHNGLAEDFKDYLLLVKEIKYKNKDKIK